MIVTTFAGAVRFALTIAAGTALTLGLFLGQVDDTSTPSPAATGTCVSTTVA